MNGDKHTLTSIFGHGNREDGLWVKRGTEEGVVRIHCWASNIRTSQITNKVEFHTESMVKTFFFSLMANFHSTSKLR